MSEATPKRTVRLELTPLQKEQIRRETGREVNRLELQVEVVPAPADPPMPGRCVEHASGWDPIPHSVQRRAGDRRE